MDNPDLMDLPKSNPKMDKSRGKQQLLQLYINSKIHEFEIREGYKFELYEIDSVLLNIVKRHHEAYINKRFGDV